MKKFLFPLLALMAIPVVLTACSDDDDKTPTVSITTGQIPSKNVFVTIDGSYLGTADGVTEITGTVDPTATVQHLQLKCPSMFIVYSGTDIPLEKSVPTFDVTVTTDNGKTTLSGNYEGELYEIEVTGEVTVNYAGENDWKLNFEQKKTFFGSVDNPYKGRTFEFDFSKDDIFALDPIGGNIWSDELDKEFNGKEMVIAFFDKFSEAVVTNSGVTAVRIVFGVDTYELWFRDEGSGEYVKDESEHRYLTNGSTIYFLDEPEFKKKQAEFFNLKPMGLNFTNTEMNFAQQKLVYEPGSAKEWCVTGILSATRYNGKEGMRLLGSFGTFFSNWENTTDKETTADKEFGLLQKWEKEGLIVVNEVVLFKEI